MTARKTSIITKNLKTNSGDIVEWQGIGWASFHLDQIIVTNGYEKKCIKREDFLKCETMADLIKMEIKQGRK